VRQSLLLYSIMKVIFIGFLFLCSVLSVNAQSLNVDDLIKLTSMNYEQANMYLIREKHYTALPIINAKGTTVAQFSKNGLNGITELVIKSEWQDEQNVAHPFVHYDVRPKSYINIIIGQLKSALFSIISKESDKNKNVWLYENGRYMMSIYTFAEKKLPASIEIHLK